MKHIKNFLKIAIIFVFITMIVIFVADTYVKRSTKDKIHSSTETIPYNKVGLLLGTGKILSNGEVNLYYKYRIDAALKLFSEGKIDVILVSGDNSTPYYNEPSTIKEDLIKGGIPTDSIFLDYAGFRTLDSVMRSKEIFGQTNITIISQPFHNERAICIANHKNINAVGFNAEDVSSRYGLKTQLREKFARVKMLIDLVIDKQPKFLGEKILIS